MDHTYNFSLSLYENGQWDECCDLLEEQIPLLEAGEERERFVLLLALLYLQKRQIDALNRLISGYIFWSDRKELIYLILGDAIRANTQVSLLNKSQELYALGLYWENQNNIKESLRAYSKSLEVDPYFLPSYNNLALLHEKMGEVIEAKNLYERGLAIDKENSYLQINLTILLSRIGSFKKKWTISESLVSLPPSLLAALISFLFVRDNHPSLAIKVLNKQLSQTEKIPSLWYARGLILESQGYFEQAFSSYQKAWQLDFSNKTVLRALLQLLFKNKRTAEMIEILSLVKEETPYREDVRFFFAVLEMQNKEWEKAELNLRYILNHTQVKNLYHLGKNIQGIGPFNPIINLDLSESFYEQSLYLLAVLYDHTQKYEQSLLLLTRLEEEVPTSTLYTFSVILLLTKIGRIKEALEKVNKTLEKQDSHFVGQLLKAKILAEKGDLENAIKILNSLDQNSPEVSFLNQEILSKVTFSSTENPSALWLLPWPNLENSLKKYFIDSPQRRCRFLWQINGSTFPLPSSPGELLNNQEMLAFYQETPLNASSPLTHLHDPLEEGEELPAEAESHKTISLSAKIDSSLKEEITLTPLLSKMTLTGSEIVREYTLEDLAILFDSLDGSSLIQGELLNRIEKAKEIFLPSRFFESIEKLKDSWKENKKRLT